jgi:hypothetical protein
MGFPLKVTRNDWPPISIGQAIQFFDQRNPRFPAFAMAGWFTSGANIYLVEPLAFPCLPPASSPTQSDRCPACHLEKPSAYGLAVCNGPRLSRQCQKSGLESVFSVLFVVKHFPANAIDELPVPPDQRLESRLITRLDDTLKKLAIGQRAYPLSYGVMMEMPYQTL